MVAQCERFAGAAVECLPAALFAHLDVTCCPKHPVEVDWACDGLDTVPVKETDLKMAPSAYYSDARQHDGWEGRRG